MKKILLSATAAALALSMFGCAGTTGASDAGSADGSSNSNDANEIDLSFSKRDLDPSYDEAGATKITLSGDSASIDGEGATADGSTVTLSADATYIVTGELNDGQMVVDAGDEDKLQIVLAGASIANADGPAFLVSNADKCFITLADGTTNSLADGADYRLDADDNADAALFSHDDLTINGTGSLEITGNYKHAVVSKDDLVMTGGTISATAKEDTFQGKDALKIADGSFTVSAGDDAFHSEYLFYVKDGTIDIETCNEGYEAEKVIIDGGEHNVYATDDAINASVAEDDSADNSGNTERNGGTNGVEGVEVPDGGSFDPASGGAGAGNEQAPNGRATGGGIPDEQAPGGQMPGGEAPSGEMPDGQAPDGATPSGGADGMPSGNPPELPGNMQDGNQQRFPGNMQDMQDGMQRDENGGDNGFTPGGGGFGGMDGGMAQSSDECLIQINGGTLKLVGQNDAIDSNGNIEINGGTLLVCGPSNGMDGSMDYDLSAQVNGGTLLMLGSVGSTRGLDSSDQPWSIENIRGNKGDTVNLIDASGETIATVDAAMAFQNAFVSAPSIASGDSYTLQVGSESTTFTME